MARKNLPAAELRKALIEAGLQLLRERGVAPGLQRVTLKDAIERAGVPRSSAYLLLGADRSPTEQFQLELLSHLDETPDNSETLATVMRVFDAEKARIESGDPAQLAYALREIIRQGIQTNVEVMAQRTEWRVYLASLAASGTGAAPDPAIVEMHHRAGQNYSGGFLSLYNDVMAIFGLRLREPMTTEELAAASTAAADGIALRMQFDPLVATIKRITGPDGEIQIWNAVAIAFEGFCLAWLEPDPEAEVSADLRTWIAF